MNGVKIEKSWEHEGLQCEVRIMPMGHRCGYVAVDRAHPLHGVHHARVKDDLHYVVNGGLTYSRPEGDDWVFGFDYNHCWDNQDPVLITDENRNYTEWKLALPDYAGRIPTLELAMSECNTLAEMLAGITHDTP